MSEEVTQQQSSLSKYYRRPKLSVKLPTNGLWYNSEVADINENATIEILSMSALDEIKAQTPDLLADNNFKFDLIKSCCPKIHKPELMMNVDIEALMYGIFTATYGNNYKSKVICPNCLEKHKKLETEEARKQAIDNKEICITEQEFVLPAESVLERTIVCKDTNIFVEEGELRIYLKPISVDIVDEYNTTAFYQEMLEKNINEITESANTGLKDKEEAVKEIQTEVKKYSDKLYETVLLMLIKSISFIEIIPTGERINDEKEITDFIKNSSYEVVDKIRSKRDESFDKIGVPSSVKVECPYCHSLIDAPTVIFNPTAFFDTAS